MAFFFSGFIVPNDLTAPQTVAHKFGRVFTRQKRVVGPFFAGSGLVVRGVGDGRGGLGIGGGGGRGGRGGGLGLATV